MQNPYTKRSVSKITKKPFNYDSKLYVLDEDELSDPMLGHSQYIQIEDEINYKVKKLIKKRTYNWEPVVYDEDTSWAYLFGKAPYDYAVMRKVIKSLFLTL